MRVIIYCALLFVGFVLSVSESGTAIPNIIGGVSFCLAAYKLGLFDGQGDTRETDINQ